VIGDPATRAEATLEPRVVAEPSALLRFQYAPSGSGVSRRGLIRPGAWLAIEYDPSRLANAGAHSSALVNEVIAHVRFHPGGQIESGPVARSAASDQPAPDAPARPAAYTVLVPEDARQVELWFERRSGAGPEAWDSRYGQNFWFDVDLTGLAVPRDSVRPRSGAIVDGGMVAVVAAAAAKKRTPAGGSGSRIVVRLAVEARVCDAASARAAWIDLHVFDGAEERVHAATVPLDRPAADGEAARFVWDDVVYRGSGGGSGVGVTFRPDAHMVQYRLYGEVHGQLFTDGVLHQLALPPDRELGP
jgi:hypothetical protein